MSRTSILIVLFVALGAAAYFFVAQGEQAPSTSIVGADREFSVPREDIQKIFIADRNGNKTTLEREDDHWQYNGTYKARPDAVENLLRAVENVRMRFKPTEAALPTMIESLATNGLKVEIYGKNDELLKAYYIGGATNDELGTYIILDGAKQPYVADIPGWQGNIRFRYNLKGDDWRDRTVFGTPADEIATVSVEYPKQQDKSFRLSFEADPAGELSPFYPLSPKRSEAPNPGRVDAYRYLFESVQVVKFNNFNREREEISQRIPFAIVRLTDTQGKEYSLKLWPDHAEASVDPKTGVVINPKEVTSFYALNQDNDFLVMQNRVLNKFLWSYDFFFR
ncbi:MAG: DUF4340 domain-containing protein [Bacteroidota bacterium]